MKNNDWKFAVVGMDTRGPRYLSFQDHYHSALHFCEVAMAIGWQAVRIYDASLREVKGRPFED